MSLSIFSALVASILVAAKDVVSKKVSTAVNPLVSSFASFLFAIPYYLLILAVLWMLGIEDFTFNAGFWSFVVLRALSDTCAESGRMLALKRGEFSSVASIISLHPIITLIISPLITGDQINSSIVYGVLFASLGTYFFSMVAIRIDLKTFLISIATAVFLSLNNCFDRLSVLSASPTMSGFAMNTLAALLTWPLALLAVGKKGSFGELHASRKPFLLRGFFETVFMVTKLYAMTVLQAPVLSAILRLSLVFQVIAGKTIFHEKDLVYRIIGSMLIIAGSIVSLQ